MHMKQLVFGLVLLLQACGPLLAQTPTPGLPEAPGILESLMEQARAAKAKAQTMGETLMGFFHTYYKDNIQPVATNYSRWASDVRSSVGETIQTAIDNIMPYK